MNDRGFLPRSTARTRTAENRQPLEDSIEKGVEPLAARGNLFSRPRTRVLNRGLSGRFWRRPGLSEPNGARNLGSFAVIRRSNPQ